MAARAKKQEGWGSFPYPEGHYMATPSIARNSHSSGSMVRRVNEALGIEGDIFNGHTRDAVVAKQADLGLPVTGVVDEVTWDVLAGGEVPKTEAGGPDD